MADRLRRQKDIITRSTDSYITATTEAYSEYFEGSPSYVTYFSIDRDYSTEDIGLEAVNSFTGADSPTKYKQIMDTRIYGIDALQVSNDITERGLQSTINGEFVMKPDSGITPVAGDFFVFNYEGMTEHLFKVTDVQFDKITPNKYYRCAFALYPFNIDDIYDNISGSYTVSYSDDGTAILTEEEAATSDSAKDLVDAMIDKYESMFYDEDSDTFAYLDPAGSTFYWSPYLQHFMHDTKCMSRYDQEILTEIYISDINEADFPKVYSEKMYRNSIFRNLTTQNSTVRFPQTFLAVDNTNLKLIRNLPFFNSRMEFKVIRPVIEDGTGFDYANSFLAFYEEGVDESQGEVSTVIRVKNDGPLMHELVRMSDSNIAILKEAVYEMSTMKRGALIVIMGNDDIYRNGAVTQPGVMLNHVITKKEMMDTFIVGTPLHDGAMILSGNEILSAAVYLKPTSKAISGKFGARHQAALGVSENSDAIAILVSEENGAVMIAYRGAIAQVASADFIDKINEYYSLNISAVKETILDEYIETPKVREINNLRFFKNVDHYHKVHKLDALHLKRLEQFISVGDVVYECYRHELEPTKVYLAVEGTEGYSEYKDISLPGIFSSDEEIEGMYLLYIIKSYLKGTLSITEDLLEKLNDYYYEQNIQTYILMPMVIYVLKQCISDISSST